MTTVCLAFDLDALSTWISTFKLTLDRCTRDIELHKDG